MAGEEREDGEREDGYPTTAYHDEGAGTLTIWFGPRAEEAAC
jgi:hypothetical protein